MIEIGKEKSPAGRPAGRWLEIAISCLFLSAMLSQGPGAVVSLLRHGYVAVSSHPFESDNKKLEKHLNESRRSSEQIDKVLMTVSAIGGACLFFVSFFAWYRLARYSTGNLRIGCFCMFIVTVGFGIWSVAVGLENPLQIGRFGGI